MTIRTIPGIAVVFVEGAEACRLTAYRDSGGVWTIGYGHTGPEVVAGLVWTKTQCLAALVADLQVAARRLASVLHPDAITVLTEHEYAALISFVFNLGANPDWTIWKVADAGNLEGVPPQMRRFDRAKVNGVSTVIPGLDHRRLAEIHLWQTADTAAAIAIVQAAPVAAPPSSYTRAIETPPAPAVVRPLVGKSFSAGVGTAIASVAVAAGPAIQGAATGVKQVSDAISPYHDAAPLIAHAIQYLAMGSAALAVTTVVLMWVKHHYAVKA